MLTSCKPELVGYIPFIRSLLELLLVPINLSITYIKSIFTLISHLVSQKQNFKSSRFDTGRVKSVVLGLTIGFPVVFALVVVLSGADPIYAKFVQSVIRLDWFNIPVTWQTRILFSLFWFCFLAPLLLFRRQSEFHSPLQTLSKVTFTREISIVMLLVAITLGSFLVIQAPYVFANVPFETDLSKFGVATYSEYVKKGFFELFFVAAFIYSLVWLGLIFLRGKTKTEQGFLRFIQLFILTEFAIFLLSIFRRIYLYQLHHGWSLVRVYGGLFVVWLTFITLTLALRHFYAKRWVLLEAGFTAALTLFFGIFNAEHFIATTHPPTVNKRIDYVYLSRMSADGYEGWKKSFAYAQGALVNRNLQNKVLINRDERREVAYAGMVTRNLVANYHELIQKYASLEEWRDHNTAIYYFVLDSLNRDIYQLEATTTQQTKIDLEKQLSEIEHSQEKFLMLQTHDGYLPAFDFTQPLAIGFDEQSALYSFYWIGTGGGYFAQDERGTLDYIFTWNGTRARFSTLITREIPLESLFVLQRNYFELAQQIRRQPPEERGYDIDISFSTPFL